MSKETSQKGREVLAALDVKDERMPVGQYQIVARILKDVGELEIDSETVFGPFSTKAGAEATVIALAGREDIVKARIELVGNENREAE